MTSLEQSIKNPSVREARVILVVKQGKVGLHTKLVAPVDPGSIIMLLDLEGAPCAQPVQGALLQQGDDVLNLDLHGPVLLRPLDSVMVHGPCGRIAPPASRLLNIDQ